MSKYIEQIGEKELIIKTNIENINNLKEAKNELSLNINNYNILEYTKDYMHNLIETINDVNNNWNSLLDISITYHKEINYNDEVNYTGVNNSIVYKEEPEVFGKVNTTGKYLNVLNSPNGEIISSIAPGEEVKILEKDKDGWTKIAIGEKEAFVCSRYITLDEPLKVINTYTVDVDNLNIRDCPNGKIITSIPYNTKVQILEENHNEWTKILYDGKIAYVTSRGLR